MEPRVYGPGLCDYCGAEMDDAREFVYEYEREGGILDPTTSAAGPARTCRRCHESLRANHEALEQERQAEAADSIVRRVLQGVGLTVLFWIVAALLSSCR